MIYRLGKLPPVHDERTLKMARYTASLPPLPAECSYFPKVSYLMFGNDTLGDCVAAAAGHMIEGWTYSAGKGSIPTRNDVLKFYQLSGWNPSDPSTDQGWDILSMMKKFRTVGLGGDKIVGFMQLAPGNWNQLKQAIALFGSVCLGFALPDAVVPQAPGSDWTKIPWKWAPGMTPNQDNGHCVPAMAYTSTGWADFESWAARMGFDQEFYENANDEGYAAVTQDFIKADGLSPSGFDIPQLLADQALVIA
jgi:hypothetical protein